MDYRDEEIEGAFITLESDIKAEIVKRFKRFTSFMQNTFYDTYYGVRILSPPVVARLFVLLFIVLEFVIYLASTNPLTNRFIHTQNSNEAVTGTITILLGLLIPVAIALIDDSKEEVLDRQTVVRRIISFRTLVLFIFFMSLFFFMPTSMIIYGNFTLRSAFGGVVILGIIYILTTYFKAYKWLSDNSLNSAGYSQQPDKDESIPSFLESYRFAQVMSLLSRNGKEKDWTSLWSRWFPPQYESAIHTVYFERTNRIIKSGKSKKFSSLATELDSYRSNMSKRNTEAWWFYNDYLPKFIEIYENLKIT